MFLLPVVADERCAGQTETGRSFPALSIAIELLDEERESKLLSGTSHPLNTRKDCWGERIAGGLLERKTLVNTNC